MGALPSRMASHSRGRHIQPHSLLHRCTHQRAEPQLSVTVRSSNVLPSAVDTGPISRVVKL